MSDPDWLAQKFEEKRSHLRAVAYRMLGSLTEADDAVQEAWLRLSRSDTGAIENLDGWLTTVVGRVCLDALRSRKSRREEPFDAHVPDLVVSRDDSGNPEHEALLADSIGVALVVVLQTLAPDERLAFVLHDIFAVPFAEIAAIVGCSTVAARQLASRARRRVRGASVNDADVKQQRKVVDAFFTAVRGGGFDALIAVLDPDVVVRNDYGEPRQIRGARVVAEHALMFAKHAQRVEPVLVNGVPGIVSWLPNGQIFSIMSFTVKGDTIAAIDVIRDPDRLGRLDLTTLS
jgi:RNA polymerase sigma factor (sigma-70 family)